MNPFRLAVTLAVFGAIGVLARAQELPRFREGFWVAREAVGKTTIETASCDGPSGVIGRLSEGGDCKLTDVRFEPEARGLSLRVSSRCTLTSNRGQQLTESSTAVITARASGEVVLQISSDTPGAYAKRTVRMERVGDCPAAKTMTLRANPCVEQAPLDCSVPWLAEIVAPHETYFSQKFGRACVRHDYCYRHGSKTYCSSREKCDAAFRDDMYRICSGVWLSWLCRREADIYYNAVSKFGSSSYKSGADSTCCPYLGDAYVAKVCEGTGCQAAPTPTPRPCARCCELEPDRITGGVRCKRCIPANAQCP